MLVLRSNNVLEMREFDQKENQRSNTLIVNMENANSEYTLKAEDLFVLNQDEVAINCANKHIVIISYSQTSQIKNGTLDQLANLKNAEI